MDLDQSIDRRADDEDQRCRPEPPADPKQGQSAVIGDPTYADAILDRLVHNAQRIDLSGDSLRRKRSTKTVGSAAEP